MLLSPEQFARLIEYASYSSHKLLDMLTEFSHPEGMFYRYLSPDLQTIDFESLSPVPDLEERRIPLKPLVCYLSLLEGAPPEDKLEFVFHVYDNDGNGYLDHKEVESIIEQMMNVARYQQWDTIELEPILRQMMQEIDYDNDGIVSLEEWKRGGLTTIPLLVLLGFDTEIKEDGFHIWRLRHFSKPTYCNVCLNMLVGWGGKQGLACSLCKYTVHERCVHSASNNCIHTYNSNASSMREQPIQQHHWMDSNCAGKCSKCKANVGIFQGRHCRWCKNLLHSKCISLWPTACDFGQLAASILPPVNIIPTFLDRSSTSATTNNTSATVSTITTILPSTSQQQPQIQNTATINNNGARGGPLQLKTIPLSPNSRSRPLLVLINPKSGGRQGERIFRKLQYLLNPRQASIFNYLNGPEPGLNLFKSLNNYNVLVCGGDGTVGWVLESMDKMEYGDNRPPVAVLPLGTGNDLARCLKWGGGYENEPLQKILHQIEKANQVLMDRWQITIEQTRRFDKGDPQPYHIINNYFSIGVDASIAHRFHVMREKYPEKFNSRMRNKLWYFELGTSETLSSSCKNLHEQIDILCDGETIDLGVGPNLEGIALLNIASIYGGSNLWGNSRKSSTSWHIPYLFPQIANSQLQHRVQDIGDKLIEVVGLESAIQMGQIKAGVRQARRLAQCSTVVIQTHKTLPMQIDGEPWTQPPAIIQVIHKNQAPMLIGL
uniref:Diacylglycerol kinase n=1 Tax=Meloidogyne javanica TaxID=6303 RepID=A0A915ML97_MELJA